MSYVSSPFHSKTLDIIGKTTNVRDIGIDQLKEYCQYMRIDYGCHTYEETESMLTSLYGWDLTSRALDLKRAWIECTSNTTINSSSSLGSLHHIAPSQQPYSSSSKIPLIIKKEALSKSILLCQVNDKKLKFEGDSGAIGRIQLEDKSSDSVLLDLKGRQFRGHVFSGPLVLFANFSTSTSSNSNNNAPPPHISIAKDADACQSPKSIKPPSQPMVVAKVDALTNEFCHFDFVRDQLADLLGHFSGDINMEDEVVKENEGKGEFVPKESGKKRVSSKKSKITDGIASKRKAKSVSKENKGDSDSEQSVISIPSEYDSSSEEFVSESKKSKKVNSKKENSSNPKISTITQRRRSKNVGSSRKKKSTKS